MPELCNIKVLPQDHKRHYSRNVTGL